MMFDPGCSLCSELSGGHPPLHRCLSADAPASRVLKESQHWVVVPSLGPLVVGHLMLVSKVHKRSVLSSSLPAIQDCDRLLGLCGLRLTKLYSKGVVVFEHGAGNQERSGACIDHAHLHVLPGPERFVDVVLNEFVNWTAGRSLSELRESVLSGAAYLLVGSIQLERIQLHILDEPIPSQYLRRAHAEEVRTAGHWDWRREARLRVFADTIQDWRNYDRTS